MKIKRKKDVVLALEQAMIMKKPVVINAYVDAAVPVLPPHISFEQMKSFASSIFKGDTNTWDMIRQTSKDIFAGLLK